MSDRDDHAFDDFDDDEYDDDNGFDEGFGGQDFGDEDFGDDDFGQDLDDHESALIRQDLVDLEAFEGTFRAEGFRGVSVFCQDCLEEHYYPWEMLRENLTTLLETGETPVHEPAFAPDPHQYIQWEYAKGYVDALTDAGLTERAPIGTCPRCRFELPIELQQGNFCPRCGAPMAGARLRQALVGRGLAPEEVDLILREVGLPD